MGSLLRRALLASCVFGVTLSACDDLPDGEPEPLPPEGVEVGERAQPLQGEREGSAWTLDRDRRPQALVFYRGYSCGLCRQRLQELEGSLDAYRRAGVEVVALTPDGTEEVGRTREELGLSFPIVTVSPEMLAGWNVLNDHGVVRPATFLLDDRGVIRYRHLGRNAADRASDIEVLAAHHQHRRTE